MMRPVKTSRTKIPARLAIATEGQRSVARYLAGLLVAALIVLGFLFTQGRVAPTPSATPSVVATSAP